MTIEELTAQLEELRKEVQDLKKELTLTYRQQLRLTNALQGSKTYYVATGPTGVTQTPLGFKDGILQTET